MRKILAERQRFDRADMSADQAIERIQAMDQPFKLELASELAAMPAAGIAQIKRTSNAPLLDELRRLALPDAW